MRRAILKIKEGLAYLSLDLIYGLKELSQKLFRANAPFSHYGKLGQCTFCFYSGRHFNGFTVKNNLLQKLQHIGKMSKRRLFLFSAQKSNHRL
jgi:hypothetical protein